MSIQQDLEFIKKRIYGVVEGILQQQNAEREIPEINIINTNDLIEYVNSGTQNKIKLLTSTSRKDGSEMALCFYKTENGTGNVIIDSQLEGQVEVTTVVLSDTTRYVEQEGYEIAALTHKINLSVEKEIERKDEGRKLDIERVIDFANKSLEFIRLEMIASSQDAFFENAVYIAGYFSLSGELLGYVLLKCDLEDDKCIVELKTEIELDYYAPCPTEGVTREQSLLALVASEAILSEIA